MFSSVNYLTIIFVVAVAGIIWICIPFYITQSHTEDIDVSRMKSYEHTLLVGFGLSAALIVNKLWDIYEVSIQILPHRLCRMYQIDWILLIALICPDLILYCQLNSSVALPVALPTNLSILCDCRLIASTGYVVMAISGTNTEDKFGELSNVLRPRVQAMALLFTISILYLFRSISCGLQRQEERSYISKAISIALLVISSIQSSVLCYTWHRFVSGGAGKGNSSTAFSIVALAFKYISSLVITIVFGSFTTKSCIATMDSVTLDYYAFLIFVLMVMVARFRLHLIKTMTDQRQCADDHSSFIRFLSHEMRTPLNIIQLSEGFVSGEKDALRLGSDVETMEMVSDALGDIRNSCETAVNVLDDVTTVDRMRTGKLIFEPEVCNPTIFMAEVFSQFSQMAKRRRIVFRIKHDRSDDCEDCESGLDVHLDKKKIFQVLRNLLLNAFKFTSANGSVTLRFSIAPIVQTTHRWFDRLVTFRRNSVAPGDATVNGPNDQSGLKPRFEKYELAVDIIDTGIGISKENLPRLFGQYAQFGGRLSRQQDSGLLGSGLGLWISRRLVELHGGVISASSAGEGLGSTFSIRIPLRAAAPPSQVGTDEGRMVAASLADILRRDNKSSSDHANRENIHPAHSREDIKSRESKKSRISEQRSQSSDHRPSASRRGSWRMLHVSRSPDRGKDIGEQSLEDKSDTRSRRRDDVCSVGSGVVDSRWSVTTNRNAHAVASGRGGCSNAHGIAPGKDSSSSSGGVDFESDLREAFEPPPVIGTLQILIVDDCSPSRRSLGRLLAKQGHTISEAGNGKQALQTVKESLVHASKEDQLDIIILDDIMPVMGGPQAAKCLRELGYQGTIVGLTGNVYSTDAEFFCSHGADVVLPKPLHIEDLQAIIDDILNPDDHPRISQRPKDLVDQDAQLPQYYEQLLMAKSQFDVPELSLKQKLRFVLVSRDPATCQGLTDALESDGQSLMIVPGPAELMRLLDTQQQGQEQGQGQGQHRFDLLLTDITGASPSPSPSPRVNSSSERVRLKAVEMVEAAATAEGEGSAECNLPLLLQAPTTFRFDVLLVDESALAIAKRTDTGMTEGCMMSDDPLETAADAAPGDSFDEKTFQDIVAVLHSKRFPGVVVKLLSASKNLQIYTVPKPVQADLLQKILLPTVAGKKSNPAAICEVRAIDEINNPSGPSKTIESRGGLTAADREAGVLTKALPPLLLLHDAVPSSERGLQFEPLLLPPWDSSYSSYGTASLGGSMQIAFEEISLSKFAPTLDPVASVGSFRSAGRMAGSEISLWSMGPVESMRSAQSALSVGPVDSMGPAGARGGGKVSPGGAGLQGVGASELVQSVGSRKSKKENDGKSARRVVCDGIIVGPGGPSGLSAVDEKVYQPHGIGEDVAPRCWDTKLHFLIVDDSSTNRKVIRRLLEGQKHRVSEACDGVEFLEMMELSFLELAGKSDHHQQQKQQQQQQQQSRQQDSITTASIATTTTRTTGVMCDEAAQQPKPKLNEEKGASDGLLRGVDRTRSGFDVVLMDHHMPRMTGSEATKAIRELGYRGLIVGLTGHTLAEDVALFLASGADHVLPKPLKLPDLKDIVISKLNKLTGLKIV